MDTLSRQLDAFMQGVLDRADPKTAAIIRQAGEDPVVAEQAKRAVHEGDLAPDFTLPDQNGRPVSLKGELARGPVVLTFFRGGWCPFCVLTLRALAAVQARLKREGATLLALSPQPAEANGATAERHGLRFPLLSDHGNAVARRYGLVWEPSPEMRAVYQRLGHVLPKLNAADDWSLPMPAGYVIGRDGRVFYSRVDPHPNRRMEPAEAVAAVHRLESASAPVS